VAHEVTRRAYEKADCAESDESPWIFPYVGYFSPGRAKNNLRKEEKYHAAAG